MNSLHGTKDSTNGKECLKNDIGNYHMNVQYNTRFVYPKNEILKHNL